MTADIIWTIAVVFLALASIGSALTVYGCCVVKAQAERGKHDDRIAGGADTAPVACPAKMAA
jgi:hypothetical protein